MYYNSYTFYHMAKSKSKSESRSWRLTLEDQRILKRLQDKLGVNMPAVLRLGLRALALKEGLSA